MPASARGLWPVNARAIRARTAILPNPAGRVVRDYAFGTQPLFISATLTGRSAVLAIIGSAAWSLASNGWTKAASGRASVVLAEPGTDDVAVRLSLADPAHNVMAMLRCDRSGRSGYEVGVISSGGTRLARIRRVSEAQVIDDAVGQPFCPSASSDTPNSGGMSVDVSSIVPAGEPYTIDARIAGGWVELRINDRREVTLRHQTNNAYATTQTVGSPITFDPRLLGGFSNQKSIGWVSDQANARVIAATWAPLQSVSSGVDDVLVAVGAGAVWATTDATTIASVSGSVFPPDARVRMVEANGQMWMIGGGKAKVFDPVRRTVSDWTPTAGSLPGQSGPGTTTSTAIALSGTRIVLNDDGNAWFSRVANPLDFDTSADTEGRAFALTGTRPLKVGQPITAMIQAANSVLIIGCANSMHQIIGDPALGAIESQVILQDTGVPGPAAMIQAADGVVMALTTHGLTMIPVGGAPINLSRAVFTGPLHVGSGQPVEAFLVREPNRFRVHIFITPNSGVLATHYVYDERAGGMSPTGGGFFPMQYPRLMQPVCGVVWKGETILGCADGYLRAFDENAAMDDDQPVNAFMDAAIVGDGFNTDAEVSSVRVLLTRQSGDARVQVFGADTTEELYGSERRLLLTDTARWLLHSPHPATVRAPAVSIVIGPSVDGKPWRVTAVSAEGAWDTAGMVRTSTAARGSTGKI